MNNVKRSRNKKRNIRVAILLIFTMLCASGMNVHAENYEYDELNRVKKVTYDDGSYVEYAYDANGNILSVAVHQDGSGNPGADHKHILVKHERVEATVDTPGNIEYWECTDCGKLFADAEGRVEIQPEDIVIPSGGNPSDSEVEKGISISFDECTVTKGENGEYEMTYTGSALLPGIIVKNNGKQLTEGTDYTLKYSNNVKCSTSGATAKVVGKGTYSGNVLLKFKVAPQNIEDPNISVGSTVTANGKKADPVVVYQGMTLKKGKDYTVEVNERTATIRGIGNFTGNREVEITETGKEEYKKTGIKVVLGKVNKIYNGEPQTLSATELQVKNSSGDVLKIGTDYDVSYSPNVNVGTVKATVVGKGAYRGTVKKSFKIAPAKTIDVEVEKDQSSYTYAKSGVKPILTVSQKKAGGSVKKLTEGRDYKVSYSANKKVGTGKFKLTFIGNYKGAKYNGDNSFSITAMKMTSDNTTVIAGDMIYKKAAKYQPGLYVIVGGTLLTKSNYQTVYSESGKITLGKGEEKTCTAAVTGKGAGYECKEAIISSYTVISSIERADVSKAKVILSQNNKTVKSVAYTGEAITFPAGDNTVPKLEVKIGRVTISGENVEKYFDIFYADNVEKGKATIILRAKDNSPYIGTCSGSFTISAAKMSQ